MFDNGSGHYRPTVYSLKKVIKFLHFERGVGMLDVLLLHGVWNREPPQSTTSSSDEEYPGTRE